MSTLKGMLHQNFYDRLGALGAGLLNFNPREPQTFGRTLGRGVQAMNQVPSLNPLQLKLAEVQLAQARAAAEQTKRTEAARKLFNAPPPQMAAPSGMPPAVAALGNLDPTEGLKAQLAHTRSQETSQTRHMLKKYGPGWDARNPNGSYANPAAMQEFSEIIKPSSVSVINRTSRRTSLL